MSSDAYNSSLFQRVDKYVLPELNDIMPPEVNFIYKALHRSLESNCLPENHRLSQTTANEFPQMLRSQTPAMLSLVALSKSGSWRSTCLIIFGSRNF